MNNLEFDIYIYLNNPHLALDDRTATGIANAMRVSKDTAGDKLKELISEGLIELEPVGNSNVYFIKFENHQV
ncbi:MAG: MarR family transcriptional regulator [Firmicutes bacterium]|nr:MarR family transcriptional regulator [Bacillota bacterium]